MSPSPLSPSGIEGDPRRPPALVLGTGITALGVVRALGRAGIPLHVLSADPGFVRTSRWYRPPPHGRPLLGPAGLAGYLRGLPLDGGVLVPTSDHDVLAVAALPPDLRERFPACQTEEATLRALLDKGDFGALLLEHGVPHPTTLPVRGPDDLDRLPQLEDLGRVFIKPRDSQEFSRRLRVKALRPEGVQELRSSLAWLEAEGLPVVLQEYVPGPPDHHYFLDGFVDRNGIVRALLARRRLRMSSPEFGNSCATVSVPLAEVGNAARDLERLLKAVSYRGPFDAEFKLDARGGVFQLLEINVRPWWQVEFAALCGVDVVTMLYRDALGLAIEDVGGYRVGLEWILPYHDLSAGRHMLASGEITLRAWLASWLRSRWGGFGWDDPLPGVAAGLELLRRHSRKKTVEPMSATPIPGTARASHE